MVQPPQAHSRGKYDNSEKSRNFRFDDDDKMSYTNIPLITCTWIGQLNNTTRYIASKIRKVTKITKLILDTLSTEYTQEIFSARL